MKAFMVCTIENEGKQVLQVLLRKVGDDQGFHKFVGRFAIN